MRDNHRVVSPPRRTVLRNFMRGERQYICSATITTAASGSFSSSSFSSSAAATAAADADADAATPAATTTAAAAADHPRGSIEPHFVFSRSKRVIPQCRYPRSAAFLQAAPFCKGTRGTPPNAQGSGHSTPLRGRGGFRICRSTAPEQ